MTKERHVVVEDIDAEGSGELILARYADRAALSFLFGPHEGRHVFIGEGPLTFGSANTCDVVLDGDGVARVHAKIDRDGPNWILTRLDASLPLSVDDRAVASSCVLIHGATISVGPSHVVFLTDVVDRREGTLAATVPASAEAARFVLPDGPVKKPGVLLGSSPTCDVPLLLRSVQRQHARIDYRVRPTEGGPLTGAFELSDLSGGSTFVNGDKVHRKWLDTGDVIRLGGYELRATIRENRCEITAAVVEPDRDIPSYAIDVPSGRAGATVLPRPSDARSVQAAAPRFSLQPKDGSVFRTPTEILHNGATILAPQVAPKDNRLAVKWKEPDDVRTSTRLRNAVLVSVALGVVTAGALIFAGGDEVSALPPVRHTQDVACASCHVGGAAATPTVEACTSCHEHEGYEGRVRPAHAFGEDVKSCADCHGEHREASEPKQVASARCAACHESRHSRLVVRGAPPKTVEAPGIFADVEEAPRPYRLQLHRLHDAVPHRCRACHEADGAARSPGEAWNACGSCHVQLAEGLASQSCASCHVEHRDERAAPAERTYTAASALPWSAGIVLGFLLLTAVLMRVVPSRAHERVRKVTHEEVPPPGLGRKKELETPPTECPGAERGQAIKLPRLYPEKCVGSRTCVERCPYNVLEMKDGLPELVAPNKCHECGICVEVCKFNALEMVEPSEPAKTEKVPALSADFETGLTPERRGLYVIGHAAGVSKVKNAANLGVWVVQHMIDEGGVKPGAAARRGLSAEVIILGAGPGGLAAAVNAREEGLTSIVFDVEDETLSTIRKYGASKKYEANPPHVENKGPFELETGKQPGLLSAIESVVGRAGLDIRLGVKLAKENSLTQDGDVLTLETNQGAFTALRLIVAVGMGEPRKLGPEVPVAPGTDIRYSIVEGEPPKGKAVMVNGAGNMALEVAAQLEARGNRVTIIYRGDKLKSASPGNVEMLEQLVGAGRLTLLMETSPVALAPGAVTVRTKGAPSDQRIDADVFYCLIGQIAPTKWLDGLGVPVKDRPMTERVPRTDQPQFLLRKQE
ncbi:MAG: FHA domain-containing protein [Deltaproteobacteria bacterium]